MPPTRSVSPDNRVAPRRAALAEPSRLKLPNGWYDPDSAAFDERAAADLDELLRSTTPAKTASALRPVAS